MMSEVKLLKLMERTLYFCISGIKMIFLSPLLPTEKEENVLYSLLLYTLCYFN